MAKNLLIVESPAKAKTIEKYLGKDFQVKSSFGHIRDLDKGKRGIEIENNFKPNYVISPEKKKVVTELKKAVKKVDEVWLATDEDREGEAISWHLCEVLGLNAEQTKRIVFHEITKPAIQNAVKNPRTVDIDLVNAQQARRVLDRLVGFELSELLWKKIRGRLSAGRVQSVAVKLIVDREREIMAFKAQSYFQVKAEFELTDGPSVTSVLHAKLPKRLDTEGEAMEFVQGCKDADFTVEDIRVKPAKRKPAAPFITSTLQQEASRKLGFSVSRTMSTAQRLYESGLITYMRTDSISMSELALQGIAQTIRDSYGDAYVQTRRYKSNKASAQEAHEAIRPTYFDRQSAGKDKDQQKLYRLIWQRAIASQMADAKLERTQVQIGISTIKNQHLLAEGEVLLFDGFLKVYAQEQKSEADGMLPPMHVGQTLKLTELYALQGYTKPPARYTEATLVKKLEEQGIGRPSTYAPTITKIMEARRGYVVKESREGKERSLKKISLKDGQIEQSLTTEISGSTKNRLYPTDMGMIVCDFLDHHFSNIMDYRFTANIESKFDTIARGELSWQKMLEDFYGPFHENVVNTLKTAERASGERILGKDPKSGRTLLVRMSRFGPVAQIGINGELAEDEKPKYANLRPDQNLETINFEQALDLFQLPRTLGHYLDEEVIVNTGRFGPYVRYKGKFFSLPKTEDPMTISLDRSIEIIKAKEKEDQPVHEYEGLPVTKGKGRFGPFLKWNGMYINIPRRYNPDALSVEQMDELIKAKIEKEANRYIKRWDEQNIAIENGRWGPFIRFKKKSIKLPKVNNERMTAEQASELTLEQVLQIIEDEHPELIKKKKQTEGKGQKTKAQK